MAKELPINSGTDGLYTVDKSIKDIEAKIPEDLMRFIQKTPKLE